MLRLSFVSLTLTLAFALPSLAAESLLSQYRSLALGDSVQIVVDRLKLGAADVKVVHERPTVVQELTWRPHRFVSGSNVESDPLAEMVLTFYEGRLARIAVLYDRERTKGLTDADLQEALTAVYGASILIATPPTGSLLGRGADRQTIGQWEDADTRLLLWREQYPTRVGLTLTSIAGDRGLQDAIAAGVRLDAAEAPALDLARRAAEASALQAKDEKIRRENKAGFKP